MSQEQHVIIARCGDVNRKRRGARNNTLLRLSVETDVNRKRRGYRNNTLLRLTVETRTESEDKSEQLARY